MFVPYTFGMVFHCKDDHFGYYPDLGAGRYFGNYPDLVAGRYFGFDAHPDLDWVGFGLHFLIVAFPVRGCLPPPVCL